MSTNPPQNNANASGSKAVGRTFMDSVKKYASAAERVSEVNGKKMFRMLNGQTVELGNEMTVTEAIKLEEDGLAAEKEVKKVEPVKPVADPKAKAKGKDKKEGKKEAKPAAKKGPAVPKGKGAKPKGGAGKDPKAVIKGKVGAWLLAKGGPVVAAGISKLAKFKANEQTHEDAGTKLGHTQKALVPPSNEGQSQSNAGQVNNVESKPAPQPSEAAAKKEFNDAVQANIPKSIKQVDNFKNDNKAQHMSSAVSTVINTDKNAVNTTFSDMKQTPPPQKSDVVPVPLPPPEAAPVTPKMNIGANTIAPLQKEHTDVSNYTKDADNKLKEEGVTQEQLDMVDSGDLAEANKEKKGMEKKAKTEPEAINNFAKNENKKVDTELQAEENKGREDLKKERKAGLDATAQKQQGTKSLMEKKREKVAADINKIYTDAQTKVTKRLDSLESEGMTKFDEGNKKATKEFEDNVKSDIDAFKDRRYSGFWGWAKKAKDWLLGMDGLPEVKAIFDRNRTAFVNKIDKLVADITLYNKKVIQECKDELAQAKQKIADYVKNLGPELQSEGKKAQEDMNGKLQALDEKINKKEQELQDKLKEKQQAAIKAIDEKIEKMKEAMSGALSKLGNLLLLAAKKFFTWALEKFGFSLAEIESIINKGAAVLKAIFTQPIKFVKNLMNAAITGFKNFGKNFVTHLKNALFEWLTGAMEGVEFPEVWDLKGIVKFGLSIIGISYANLRKHMVTAMGETPVKVLEGTFTLVKTLITEGPIAAWEQLKEMADELKNSLISAVIDFVKVKVIEQAIQWLVSLFVPGAGIIKAIIGIYDTIVFFIQKAKQILQMIGNFLGSIGEIASGNIGAAADAMEKGLARGLTLAISFLAQLLHLNGISDKIKAVIQNIRGKVDGVLAKIAKWVAEKGKALLAPITNKVNQAKEWGKEKVDKFKNSVVAWWSAKKKFKGDDGQDHTLYFTTGSANKLMMASNPIEVELLLNKLENDPKANIDRSKIPNARKLIADIKAKTGSIQAAGNSNAMAPIERQKLDAKNPNQSITEVTNLLGDLSAVMRALVKNGGVMPASAVYDTSNGPHTVEVTNLHAGNKAAGNASRTESLSMLGSPFIVTKWQLTKSSKYPNGFVRAHLVNHALGGDGMNHKNLLWVPHTVNKGGPMQSYETASKELIKNPNNLLWTKVHITSYWPARVGDPKDANDSYSANTFAKYFTMETGTYHFDPKQNDWAKDPNPKVKENIYVPEPSTPYVPIISSPSNSSFKKVSPPPAKFISEINPSIKPELISSGNAPYGTLADFKQRLIDYKYNQIKFNGQMTPVNAQKAADKEKPNIIAYWQAVHDEVKPYVTSSPPQIKVS